MSNDGELSSGKKVRDIQVQDLVCRDEAGVNLWMLRLFARAVSGPRAYGKRPKTKGENVSLLSAISLKGVAAKMSLLGSIDATTFEAFISQKLVLSLPNTP